MRVAAHACRVRSAVASCRHTPYCAIQRYFYDERAVALYTMSISGAGLLAWLELIFLLPPAHVQVAHVRIGLNQANRAGCRLTQLTVTVRAVRRLADVDAFGRGGLGLRAGFSPQWTGRCGCRA